MVKYDRHSLYLPQLASFFSVLKPAIPLVSTIYRHVSCSPPIPLFEVQHKFFDIHILDVFQIIVRFR